MPTSADPRLRPPIEGAFALGTRISGSLHPSSWLCSFSVLVTSCSRAVLALLAWTRLGGRCGGRLVGTVATVSGMFASAGTPEVASFPWAIFMGLHCHKLKETFRLFLWPGRVYTRSNSWSRSKCRAVGLTFAKGGASATLPTSPRRSDRSGVLPGLSLATSVLLGKQPFAPDVHGDGHDSLISAPKVLEQLCTQPGVHGSPGDPGMMLTDIFRRDKRQVSSGPLTCTHDLLRTQPSSSANAVPGHHCAECPQTPSHRRNAGSVADGVQDW